MNVMNKNIASERHINYRKRMVNANVGRVAIVNDVTLQYFHAHTEVTCHLINSSMRCLGNHRKVSDRERISLSSECLTYTDSSDDWDVKDAQPDDYSRATQQYCALTRLTICLVYCMHTTG